MRPVNRHHYMEGFLQVVSNAVDAAKGEKSCETESRASPSQGAADRGTVRVRYVGRVFGLRPDCGGPNVHGPWCSLRESHVRRDRRSAFQSGWSGGVDARRGLAAGGPAQHSSGRSNTAAIHFPPTCGVVAYRILNPGSPEAAMRALRERASAVRTCSRCCTQRNLSDPPAHALSGSSSRSAAAAYAPSTA